jgi:hypothetical protein
MRTATAVATDVCRRLADAIVGRWAVEQFNLVPSPTVRAATRRSHLAAGVLLSAPRREAIDGVVASQNRCKFASGAVRATA